MTTYVYGGEAAVEAVREFLEDGTHQGASSPAQTFNGFLADYRTALGVTTAVLPDVAQYERFWPRGSQANRQPYMAIIWDGSDGEQDPPGPNGREYVHQIQLVLVVTQTVIDGDEADVALAGVRYHDALRVFFLRRLPMVAQGWTLNTGGTGQARGRVIRAEITSQGSEPYDLEVPNVAVLVRLSVVMQEAY